MKLQTAILMIILMAYTQSASAIRCNSRLAEVGDTTYKFIALCGEPDFVTKRLIYLTSTESSSIVSQWSARSYNGKLKSDGNQSNHYKTFHQSNISHKNEQAIEVEEWTYDFGPHRLIQQVLFVEGVAKEINSQGYGLLDK